MKHKQRSRAVAMVVAALSLMAIAVCFDDSALAATVDWPVEVERLIEQWESEHDYGRIFEAFRGKLESAAKAARGLDMNQPRVSELYSYFIDGFALGDIPSVDDLREIVLPVWTFQSREDIERSQQMLLSYCDKYRGDHNADLHREIQDLIRHFKVAARIVVVPANVTIRPNGEPVEPHVVVWNSHEAVLFDSNARQGDLVYSMDFEEVASSTPVTASAPIVARSSRGLPFGIIQAKPNSRGEAVIQLSDSPDSDTRATLLIVVVDSMPETDEDTDLVIPVMGMNHGEYWVNVPGLRANDSLRLISQNAQIWRVVSGPSITPTNTGGKARFQVRGISPGQAPALLEANGTSYPLAPVSVKPAELKVSGSDGVLSFSELDRVNTLGLAVDKGESPLDSLTMSFFIVDDATGESIGKARLGPTISRSPDGTIEFEVNSRPTERDATRLVIRSPYIVDAELRVPLIYSPDAPSRRVWITAGSISAMGFAYGFSKTLEANAAADGSDEESDAVKAQNWSYAVAWSALGIAVWDYFWRYGPAMTQYRQFVPTVSASSGGDREVALVWRAQF